MNLRFTIYDLRFCHPGCFIVLILLACVVGANGAMTNDFFQQGVFAYRAGQFSEAAAAFARANDKHPAAGTLDNLGLTEWRRGHAGLAILSWERAQWLTPFDSRAKENLRFARQITQLDAPQLKWFEAASGWLPSSAWAWMAAIGLWLAAGMMVLPRVLRQRKAGWHQAMAMTGLCLLLFSLIAEFGVAGRSNIGFVLEKNAPLLLTPTRDGEVTSTLVAGEPGRKLQTRGNYYLIRTEYGTGWIEREQFGLIRRD